MSDDSYARQPGHVVAFEGVTVVPMDSERRVEHQTVIVEDDRIGWVGPVADAQIPVGAQRIDARAKFVMPGLADMHCHPVQESDLTMFVAHGVTSVRNLWGMPRHLKWRRQIAE